MTRMPSLAGSAGSVGKVDSAETFNETGVTVSHNGTTVSNEAISLLSSDTITPPTTWSTASYAAEYGTVINPNHDMHETEATFGSGVSGASRVRIIRISDGTTIASVTGSYSGGSTVTLSGTLTAGTKYRIVADNQGSSWTRVQDNTVGYPYTSTSFDIVGGWANGARNDNYDFVFKSITCTPKSGSTTVEWPYPPDVYSWDRGFFERVLENETADVYVEEYDGSNWVEIAGPIDPGDKLPALPSRNVRFRIDFSRTSTSNNPRLLDIHRRRVLPGGA